MQNIYLHRSCFYSASKNWMVETSESSSWLANITLTGLGPFSETETATFTFFLFLFSICKHIRIAEMNSGTKAAIFIPQRNCFQLRASLFHSTPFLERKRRNFWDCVSLSIPSLHTQHTNLTNLKLLVSSYGFVLL